MDLRIGHLTFTTPAPDAESAAPATSRRASSSCPRAGHGRDRWRPCLAAARRAARGRSRGRARRRAVARAAASCTSHMDEDSGRVIVQVRDLEGDVIRTIPPSEALDVLAGQADLGHVPRRTLRPRLRRRHRRDRRPADRDRAPANARLGLRKSAVAGAPDRPQGHRDQARRAQDRRAGAVRGHVLDDDADASSPPTPRAWPPRWPAAPASAATRSRSTGSPPPRSAASPSAATRAAGSLDLAFANDPAVEGHDRRQGERDRRRRRRRDQRQGRRPRLRLGDQGPAHRRGAPRPLRAQDRPGQRLHASTPTGLQPAQLDRAARATSAAATTSTPRTASTAPPRPALEDQRRSTTRSPACS